MIPIARIVLFGEDGTDHAELRPAMARELFANDGAKGGDEVAHLARSFHARQGAEAARAIQLMGHGKGAQRSWVVGEIAKAEHVARAQRGLSREFDFSGDGGTLH